MDRRHLGFGGKKSQTFLLLLGPLPDSKLSFCSKFERTDYYDSLDDSNMDTHKNRDILMSSEGYEDVNNKESKRKVARRPRKVPVMRSKDFLW
jgi:hypothetical protein